jgi:hypothetical protein
MRTEYFDQIRREAPALSEGECFRRAFQLYAQSIPFGAKGHTETTSDPFARVAPVLPQK